MYGLALYANLIVIRMIDYDAVLIMLLVIDIPCGGMMSNEASMLQILRNEYIINASKFDEPAK